ncbi:MAG TPA: hypothetical protein VFX35_01425 [Solirubrobacterales bacterium]|nr:hypothetical protein [Solirubrobacterales bacterium]
MAARSVRDEPSITELIGAREGTGPTPTELADAREEEELGKRTAVVELLAQTFDLSRDGLDPDVEFNREIAEAALRELADVRIAYIAAMKWVTRLDDSLAHVAIGERVNSLDDLVGVLKERWGL